MGNCQNNDKFFYKLSNNEKDYIKKITGKNIEFIPISDIYRENETINAGFIDDNIYLVRDNNTISILVNNFPTEVPKHLFKNFYPYGSIFVSNDTAVKLTDKKMFIQNKHGFTTGSIKNIDELLS